MQVGVCSGLVLGFLAAVVAVHFVTNRRAGIPFSPKASGFPGNGAGYHSPPGAYQGLPCSHFSQAELMSLLVLSESPSLLIVQLPGVGCMIFQTGVETLSLLSAQ